MNLLKLNATIDEAINLGNKLLFLRFTDPDAERYENLVSKITEQGPGLLNNENQKVYCQKVAKIKPDDYRLNSLGRIHYLFFMSKMAGGSILIRNTKEQIFKRYILDVNSMLPVLKVGK